MLVLVDKALRNGPLTRGQKEAVRLILATDDRMRALALSYDGILEPTRDRRAVAELPDHARGAVRRRHSHDPAPPVAGDGQDELHAHRQCQTDPETPPGAPWVGAGATLEAVHFVDAMFWLGGFERCLGWAFIEMGKALH